MSALDSFFKATMIRPRCKLQLNETKFNGTLCSGCRHFEIPSPPQRLLVLFSNSSNSHSGATTVLGEMQLWIPRCRPILFTFRPSLLLDVGYHDDQARPLLKVKSIAHWQKQQPGQSFSKNVQQSAHLVPVLLYSVASLVIDPYQ